MLGLALFWPAQGMAQTVPVTPSTTPGPSAPFAGRSVSTFSALPPSGNPLGDCRSVRDTGLLYCWNGAWVTGGGGGLPGSTNYAGSCPAAGAGHALVGLTTAPTPLEC